MCDSTEDLDDCTAQRAIIIPQTSEVRYVLEHHNVIMIWTVVTFNILCFGS
jgi:hypothetical protein